ncbi:GW dipeptide domain-containing protein [Lactobacillus sp. PV012]|uniref:GW dipeptide domain-containing protein n=1 Tax=Lactobacillus sp. PV012 TaxID=2594494 RepID=UPI0022407608|nr:GW dipeptide domain-containing protein [Lactobacillus sp. PV012]QNQ82552.1 hypothetical protein FP433_05600 [Lactobacillus sp. PV012]
MKYIKKQRTMVLGSFLSAAALSMVLLSNPVKADSVSSSQVSQTTTTQTDNNQDKEPTQTDNTKSESQTSQNNSESTSQATQDQTTNSDKKVGAVQDTDPANNEETTDLTNEDEEDIYTNNLKSVQNAVAKLDKQNKAANKAIEAAKKQKKVATSSKNTPKKTTTVSKQDEVKDTTFNRHVTFQAAVVKKAGSKNYNVYKSISNTGKLGKKVGNGIDYANNHIEATEVYQATKYRYWLIYVDGVRTGWVNENFFARNKIEVPKVVSLVKNPDTSFYTPYALSYATDEYGNVVGNWNVKVSTQNVDTTKAGTKKVTYSVGKKAKATVTFKIRKSDKEGIAEANAEVKPGTNNLKSWRTHYGHSENYVDYTTYAPESTSHTYKTNGLTFTTKFYQPLYLNQQPDINTPQVNAVGHIPEGMVMSEGWLYTSLLAHSNSTSGHIVAYNLNALKDPYASQNLSSLTAKSFTNYVKNMKVSPYIYTGHGQGMGASDKYIYVVANEHGRYNPADSETLLQINKSDLTVNKIWTFKAWVGDSSNPRYFHNAVIVDDNTMYALYHNTKDKTYEYWMFKRTGSNWYPTEVGATGGNFVSGNAPVQGFAYDSKHKNFYIAFNDLIVKVGQDGTYKEAYTFETGREIEGISISNNRLYVNLAQRPELLESSELTD